MLSVWATLALAAKRRRALTAAVAVVALLAGLAARVISGTCRCGRSSPVADMLGDVRTVISAQEAYWHANNGDFATEMRCLIRPQDCLPGYPADSPTFLDTTFDEPVRNGYRREFQAVAEASRRAATGFAVSFAYLGAPLDPKLPGVCGDFTGRVYLTPSGVAPHAANGRCLDGVAR